jgi:hypothetical protein
VIRFDCECTCRRSFSKYAEEGTWIACPYCGAPKEVPFEEKAESSGGECKNLEDATYEIIAEGGVPFSGAR